LSKDEAINPNMAQTMLATRWDAEYRQGRYAAEPPLPFVGQILTMLQERQTAFDGVGLYVGCGNGRNYLPLVNAGLQLYGLDVSPEALKHLTEQQSTLAPYLICEDFRHFPNAILFNYLIAIQVFQHGNTVDTATYFNKVAALLKPGGLFFLRVNSATTQIYHAHAIVERNQQGGFTIQYQEGPKRGLYVHFYARDELYWLTQETFRVISEPYEDVIQRAPPKTGAWSQWEMICERQ
jgi:SAM-dependent methyltransferase